MGSWISRTRGWFRAEAAADTGAGGVKTAPSGASSRRARNDVEARSDGHARRDLPGYEMFEERGLTRDRERRAGIMPAAMKASSLIPPLRLYPRERRGQALVEMTNRHAGSP
jgi:hypothetical protein